jgi:carboxymethylenebutenolidase
MPRLDVNGESIELHLARPPDGSGAPVLLLHPWWGLNDDIRGLADRLAESGFVVAAPDLHRGKVATTVDEAEGLLKELDDSFAEAATLAAADALLAEAGPDRRAGTIGLSMGAGWAPWVPSQRPQFGATVVYYGTTDLPHISGSSAPILGHFAESDPYEDEESIAAFEEACRTAGRELEIHRYPGTGHWFAEPSRDAYVPEAANLAFDRTVAFLRNHLLETSRR